MKLRQRTYVIVTVGLLLVAGAATFAWLNHGVASNPETLLLHLPTQDAVVAGFDFDVLRNSGVLRMLLGAKASQEPEYVDFVRESGFDYQRDLHYVLVSFAPDGEFFLIHGDFDWAKLEQYAADQKGWCLNHVCHLAGSTTDKKISFFPLKKNLMAMAVAPDEGAATRLKELGPQNDVTLPKQPVWLTFSAGALRHAALLRGSSRLFATAIMDAERVTITAGLADGNQMEARLEAACRDPQQAGGLTAQLQALMTLLRKLPEQQGQVMPQDSLAGLLASGTFAQAGSNVVGHWPIPHELLTNLAR